MGRGLANRSRARAGADTADGHQHLRGEIHLRRATGHQHQLSAGCPAGALLDEDQRPQ